MCRRDHTWHLIRRFTTRPQETADGGRLLRCRESGRLHRHARRRHPLAQAYESAYEDYGYAAFYASVDVVLMGGRTFEQCLRFDEWPYADKPCWVFSHKRYDRVPPGVTITAEPPAQLLAALQSQWLKRAWLVGGGRLAATFIPVLLGTGVPLLDGAALQEGLNLIDAKRYASGVMQLRYAPS